MSKTKVQKLSFQDSRPLSWTYYPEGKTKQEQRGEGSSVRCRLYSLPGHGQVFGRVHLGDNARHGEVTATDSCFYYVLSGAVRFMVYDQEKKEQNDPEYITTYNLVPDEVMMIEAGTVFDYVALGAGAEVMLFRNYP